MQSFLMGREMFRQQQHNKNMGDKNTVQDKKTTPVAEPSQSQTQVQSQAQTQTAQQVEKVEKTTEIVETSSAVTKRDIENVVSSWTGIPISKLTEDESAKLLQLEQRIHQRLVDQDEAVVKVSEAVRRGRIGLASGQRPIASFIFLGPSGTGKTELAKTLAEILFGRDDAMIRLDMSEYMEKHEVAKLIGAPPGYVGYEEGGQLTEAVRAKPYSIVLLDEVEKAHPDVFNILLQLLEDGRLTDNKGNTISFKNTIVICTSNIGSGMITEKLGEKDVKKVQSQAQYDKEYAELSTLVNNELRKFFRPELLNRFDDIVIFKPLQRADMVGIAKRGLEKTAKLLKEQGFSIKVTDRGLSKLAQEGYDPMYGARPLRRLIQTSIENPIALQIIGKKFVLGDTILIDYDKAKNEFLFTKPSQPKQTQITSQTQNRYAELQQKLQQGIELTETEKLELQELERSMKVVDSLTPEEQTRFIELAQKTQQGIQLSPAEQQEILILQDKLLQILSHEEQTRYLALQSKSQQGQQLTTDEQNELQNFDIKMQQQLLQAAQVKQANTVEPSSQQENTVKYGEPQTSDPNEPAPVAATKFDPLSVLSPDAGNAEPMPQSTVPPAPTSTPQPPASGLPSYSEFVNGANGMSQPSGMANEQLVQPTLGDGALINSGNGQLNETQL